MLFVREQEGIYSYGKKRVFIKIEKDSIIVRVGGGFKEISKYIEERPLNHILQLYKSARR